MKPLKHLHLPSSSPSPFLPSPSKQSTRTSPLHPLFSEREEMLPHFSTMPVVMFLLLLSFSCVAAQDYGYADAPEGEIHRRQMVPALFIFGDSLVDNGNNNDLPSFAKANYYPYGIDFNGGPTGRFSNGYTMVDQISELLGLPLIPAYSEARGEQLLHGVNYASAAAGILDVSGRNFAGRIPFNQQIGNFDNTLRQLRGRFGAVVVGESLRRCLIYVGIGSNDYLNNYLMPNYPTRNQYSPQQYADLLSQQYSAQITRLYNLGARKFVLPGLGLMGCMPNILARGRDGGCSKEVNDLVQPFNTNIKSVVNQLNSRFRDARFIYIDIYNMFGDLLSGARSYGLTVTNSGCCGVGRNQGEITCLPFQTPCGNRHQYVFWDAFHPTEAVNLILGQQAFSGGQRYAYPINIQQLADIDIRPFV